MRAVCRVAIVLIAAALVSCERPGSSAGGILASATSRQATPAPPASSVPFPLEVSMDGRHLVDQQGHAFLVNGDTPWSLMTGLTREDAEEYLEDRRTRGFNAILVNIIEHYFNGPVNQYRQHPFLRGRDFSAPNDQYFEHVDWVLTRAHEKGFLVFATPAYLGFGGGEQGWYQEIKSSSFEVLRGYGRYLGARYRNFDNLIWVAGGDYGSAESLPYTRAIVEGIQETDRPRIFTAHNARFQSGVEHHASEAWLSLNTTYSDCIRTAEQSAFDYQRPRVMPFVFIEGRYEGEGTSEICLRSQAYWSVLSGSIGHFFGARLVWGFEAGWKQRLNTPGSRSMTWFGRLFQSRPWHLLVPDLGGSLVTSGKGAPGAAYAAAALTSDRRTAIVYTPGRRELTLDLSQLAGSRVTAWWYDPRNGEAARIGGFPSMGAQTFRPESEGDWVLVVDSDEAGMPPPGQALASPSGTRK